MERLSDDGVIAAELLRRAAAGPLAALPAPRGLVEVGIPEAFIEALLLKHLDAAGELSSSALVQRLAVPLTVFESVLIRLRAQRWVDVPRRGRFDADMSWALTEAGRQRAQDAARRCAYVGPMPVPSSDYAARVLTQSITESAIVPARLREGLGDAVVPQDLFEALGAALNSDRALLLYGPSGAGKTFLAQRLGNVFNDPIWVPHAVWVEGEVIQLFDERVHRQLDAPVAVSQLELTEPHDGRWVQVQRPVVMTGGELTLDMLELQFDTLTRIYRAPPQMLAMNGVLVVDDLGRQRVPARELINRWIVPLDRGSDEWVLHHGARLRLPFDVKVVFSSNLSPEQLGDPAFMRRVGYAVHVGEMDGAHYHDVVQQACVRTGMDAPEELVSALFDTLHDMHGTPRYAALPFEVLSVLRDRAAFHGARVTLDAAAMEWAWSLCAAWPGHAQGSHQGPRWEKRA